MKKPIYPWWLPLISASILFILIRISNDVPNGVHYLTHSLLFISIELLGIVIFSYLLFYLNEKFVNKVIKHKLSVVSEYLIVLLFPVILTGAIMWLSHFAENRSLTISEIMAPGVIVMLMNVWIYSWLKNTVLERHYTDLCIQNERIQNENLSTNLKLLQAQYRPHFLFNVLNTIYFSISEENETARGAVEHLSNLLRRQLYTSEGMVPLSNEISVIESYIELYRLRFGDSISINTGFEKPQQPVCIYPYLLMPLVENAFKHVSGNKIVNIDMKFTEKGHLIFCVQNSFLDSHIKKVSGGGVGLKNLRQQLIIYYGENGYRLETSKTDKDFSAVLELYNV